MALSDIASPFVWGAGGARKTPEEIARERQIAAALMGRGDPAFHNAGWLGALGRGLEGAYAGWTESKADKAEQANADYNQGIVQQLMGGFGGGGAASFPTAPAPAGTSPAPVSSAAVDTGSTAPRVDLSGSKQEFISALLPAAMEASKRTGIDPRIIVAQAAQETGWGRSAPGNNYFGIKSHGQGGGQTFTTHEVINGKRVKIKDSFRQFASPADSVAGYADFILKNPRYRKLMEAQGLDAQLAALGASGYATDPNYARSVGAIARSIPLPDAPVQVASLDPSAGMAEAMPQPVQPPVQPQQMAGIQIGDPPPNPPIPERFGYAPEQPAPAPFDLGSPTPVPGVDVTPPEAAAPPPVQIAQALTDRNPMSGNTDMPTQAGISPVIMEALTSPYVDPGVKNIANILLQQQMQQQQAMQERIQAEEAARLEMQQRMQAAQAAGVDPRFIGDSEIWKQATAAQFREQPADIREYEYARSQGYEGSFADFQKEMKKAGATTVDARNMGSIPQGYRVIYDQNGNPVQMEPIPGGPADTSATDAAARENQSVASDTITTAAAKAREILNRSGRLAAGFGGQLMSSFGESDAAELRRQVEVLKSNAKIQNLQAMRAASPTGGALGAVSDKENEMLAAKAGAIDPNAAPDVFASQLDDYERTLLRIVHGKTVGDAIFEQTRQAEKQKPVTEMTDEELEAIINGDR